eukprot:jgi/Mesen1/8906/ME000540S08423
MATAEANASAIAAEEAALKYEGPVLTVILKKLRALRKKATRILQIEEAVVAGKAINEEQDVVLKSKASVYLLIDEYEKLRQPLEAAIKKELSDSQNSFLTAALERRAAAAAAENEAQVLQGKDTEQEPKVGGEDTSYISEVGEGLSAASLDHGTEAASPTDVAAMTQLLYFASLFDISHQGDSSVVQWNKAQERNACLAHDFVGDDSTSPLTEADLDAICALGRLVTSGSSEGVTHKDAINECLRHANNYLANSEQIISNNLHASYAGVRDRVSRILASEFCTRNLPEPSTGEAPAVGYPSNEGNQEVSYQMQEQGGQFASQDQQGQPQYYQQQGAYAQYGVTPAPPGGTLGLSETGGPPLVGSVPAAYPSQGYAMIDPAQVLALPSFVS